MSEWLGLMGRRVIVAGRASTIGEATVHGSEGWRARAIIDLQPPEGHVAADLVMTQLRAARSARSPRPSKASKGSMSWLDVFVHCVGINNRKGIEDYSAHGDGTTSSAWTSRRASAATTRSS